MRIEIALVLSYETNRMLLIALGVVAGEFPVASQRRDNQKKVQNRPEPANWE